MSAHETSRPGQVRLCFLAALVVAAALAGTDRLTAAVEAQGQEAGQTFQVASPAAGGRVSVLLELDADSAAAVFASVIDQASTVTAQLRANAGRAGQAQVQRVMSEQAQVSSAIAARGIAANEIFRVQRSMNAIALEVDASRVDALRQVPGVKAIHPLELEYPTNSTGVPFIGAPAVWGNTLGLPAGATGAGVRIGIIDTGVDYLHADFGGSGVLGDYQANDRTTAPDAFFPTAKVVGGFDFAGDNYNGSAATIAADPDPMDCNGHGTHVAGTAAGYGVNADGTTFNGPYGPSTPFSSLRIGPGSAPQAQIYALRVFGCGGGTNLTVLAIEWAMDPNGDSDMSDHLDVINMSLGSSFGGPASTSTIAAENAAAIGVIVVASAGNNGDTYFVNGSPGVSTRTISVAAAIDGGTPALTMLVNAPAAIAGYKTVGIPVSFGVVPPAGGVTGNLVQALDPADGAGPATTDACSPLTNAAAIAGNIAFIDRGTCAFNVKAKFAQDAGAIGVVIANNAAGAPGNMAGVDPTITIHAVLVSQTDGNALRTNLGAPANVTLLGGSDTLATFSSRGPVMGSSVRVKPDLAAPGYNITSAQTGTTCTGTAPSTGCQTINATGFVAGSQTLNLSGTSMAAPHITGVMALLRQLHPDWSVDDLKALAMDTATHDVSSQPNGAGVRYGAGRVGAGRADVANAAQSNVIAFDADTPGAVSVSFETMQVTTTATEVKKLRIVNMGASPATYDLGIDTVVDAPGIAFSLPGGSGVTVPAFSSIEIDVAMDANAALMDHTREASVAGSQASSGTLVGLGVLNRHWITEETGYVTFSQGGNLKLRVPLYAAPRPASTMSAASAIGDGNPTGSGTISLTGDSACTGTDGGPTCTGTLPTDVVSLVTPFELQVISPRNLALPASADIQYAGVQFDQTNNRLLFGTAMWGDRANLSDTTVNIYIDTNNDGTWDRILFSGSVGVMNTALFGNVGQDPTDTFVNASLTIATSGVSLPGGINRHANVDPGAADSALTNSNVLVQSASLTTLGVAGAFRWKVVTCPGTLPLCKQLNGFQYDEEAGPFVFDTTVANQGLNFNGGAFFFDLPGSTLPVTWNTANLAAQGSLGALLLHTHNMAGSRAEVVPMVGTTTTDLSIGIGSSPSAPSKGSTATLTVTASNLGGAPAAGAVTTIELPAGLTYVSDDGGGAFNSSTGQWTIGALAPGASGTLHLTATVTSTDPQVVSGTIFATSPIDSFSGNNQATVNVLAPRDADLQVSLVAGSPSVIARTEQTYTVTVKNNGDDQAFNVVVGESFTGGSAAFGLGTPSAGTYNSTTGTWSIGTLPKGVTQTLTFNAMTFGGPSLTTTATVASGTGDLNTANNSANATTPVAPRATSIAPSIAGSVTAGQLTPVTVLVFDTDGAGTPTNPTGTVTLTSSSPIDTFATACTLNPVVATINQSSCTVDASLNSDGSRTITASYTGSVTHAANLQTVSSAATCSFAVTPNVLSFTAAGGSSSAGVATASGCSWTGASDTPFLQVTGGASGTGNGTVAYQVPANPDGTARSATLTIGGQTFTVTQDAAACSNALAPTSRTFTAAGGAGTVALTSLTGCAWTAVSNASFIQITSAGSGTGSATISYTVSANPPPGPQRTGTMTIGGQTFQVTQSAVGTIALGRSALTYGAVSSGGALTVDTSAQPVTVQVNSADPVAWTVTADQPWIQIVSGSGTGTGSFSVRVIDATGLPPTGTLTGTVTLNASAANAPLMIPVRLNIMSPAAVTAPFGWVDTPTNGAAGVNGSLAVTGWALDDVEVTRVTVYRDPVAGEPAGIPVYVGRALFVPDARPDVELGETTVPLAYRAGWGLVVLTNVLPGGGNGPFTLRAFAEDADGHTTLLGVRSFTANNAAAAAPFGTIDSPAPGEIVSGTYANFGWALTPLPNTIPADGSTISVYIDGQMVGHPSYDLYRPDVAALFPGLSNSMGPVGAFVFDSTTLTNGLHSIAWVVGDDSGATAGIGSRFFTVRNVGASLTAGAAATASDAPVTSVALRANDLGVRRGFDEEAAVAGVRAVDGGYHVTAKVLERIELRLPEGAGPVTGYHVVGGERRELPAGSRLDAETGVFTWQPGAAFLGRYELTFVRGDIEIRVVVDLK